MGYAASTQTYNMRVLESLILNSVYSYSCMYQTNSEEYMKRKMLVMSAAIIAASIIIVAELLARHWWGVSETLISLLLHEVGIILLTFVVAVVIGSEVYNMPHGTSGGYGLFVLLIICLVATLVASGIAMIWIPYALIVLCLTGLCAVCAALFVLLTGW